MNPAAILHRALEEAIDPPSFAPVLEGIRRVLVTTGTTVDRIQLPLNRNSGFRHPTLAVVVVTWEDDGDETNTWVVPHQTVDESSETRLRGSPFEGILLRREPRLFVPDLAQDDLGMNVLSSLRERGFRGYLAIGIPIPGGSLQPLSIASRAPYGPDLPERLSSMTALLSMAIYAAYRTSQAMTLAETYIGRHSGARVLAGDIKRGSTTEIDAGIVFCDIRNFTAMTERLGAEGVVNVVNRVFDLVGREGEARGGEILKFIGDAMLLVFPVETNRTTTARAMVETARAALAGVEKLKCETSIGFGGHIGQVLQGNIGTPSRLDFTVMGPAVNLASRLESLCKRLETTAVFSAAVASENDTLTSAGSHTVKGVAEPIEAWVLRD